MPNGTRTSACVDTSGHRPGGLVAGSSPEWGDLGVKKRLGRSVFQVPMAAPILATRRRLSPDARRAELLRAGERVFTEAAYDDVSIEQDADAAGVAQNLLY